MQLSTRILNIETSQTAQFTPLIARLRKEGREIINFAVGEPHFDISMKIIGATKQALDDRKTRYGPVAGLPELKTRLAQDFEGYDEDNIVLSNGAKHALYSIFQAICNPGDEIIIPRPYWVSFPQQVKLAAGIPIFVDTMDHLLDCEAIEHAISPKTKAILVNSPNNPTGAIYPKSALETIVRLACKHDLFIIADEAYDAFVYDGLESPSIFDFPEARDRALITRSFSKRFGMTGYRVGYIAASKEIVKAIVKLQSHVTGNVCTFAQWGALAALSIETDLVSSWKSELQRKRDIAYRLASKLFDCRKPQGAFYLFPNVSMHLKKGETSENFVTRLLENAGVAVVPGEAFGTASHVRISYGVPEDLLVKGFENIAEAL
ncbi:pyridoxal phosphate-dependent aminotransferase [Thermodesulfobacteriota bacterium]